MRQQNGVAALGAPDDESHLEARFYRAGVPGRSRSIRVLIAREKLADLEYRSVQIQQPAELLSSCRLLARDISRNLILIEHLPDGSKKSRQFPSELRLALGLLRKHHQLFANEVVERALGAEAPPDSLRCSALLDPDLLESHFVSL